MIIRCRRGSDTLRLMSSFPPLCMQALLQNGTVGAIGPLPVFCRARRFPLCLTNMGDVLQVFHLWLVHRCRVCPTSTTTRGCLGVSSSLGPFSLSPPPPPPTHSPSSPPHFPRTPSLGVTSVRQLEPNFPSVPAESAKTLANSSGEVTQTEDINVLKVPSPVKGSPPPVGGGGTHEHFLTDIVLFFRHDFA